MKNETNYGLRISKDSINQGQSRQNGLLLQNSKKLILPVLFNKQIKVLLLTNFIFNKEGGESALLLLTGKDPCVIVPTCWHLCFE